MTLQLKIVDIPEYLHKSQLYKNMNEKRYI